jgi:hypothetical protein
MSQTATNYINLIKKDYPVRGRDNDSQGFRDNFTNIGKALETINQDVTDLGNIAVLSNSTATFYGNTVQEANFQNCSTELWDNGTLSGNIVIDYTLGSYQTLRVESGINNISVVNWPEEGKSGFLILSITKADSSVSVVNFSDANIQSLGPSQNPYDLSSESNVFELHSEYPAGASDNKILVKLNNEPLSNTSTDSTFMSASIFSIKHPSADVSKNHRYFIRTNTGTANATVVESTIGGSPVSSNIALNPTKIKSVTFDSTFANINLGLGDTLKLTSTDGIIVGAKFNVTTTNTILTVTDKNSTASTVTFSPPIPAAPGLGQGTTIIFRNPTFGDYGEKSAFPTMVTLLDGEEYIPANTSTGRVGVFKGSIYANTNTIEVTFKDYGGGIQNTFTATTMPATTVTNNSLDLANTMFVHMLLPPGSIIMWYGLTTNVPYGWGLCDGTLYNNLSYPSDTSKQIQSPDLRNKFVIGANATTVWNGDDAINSRIATSNILGSSTSTGGTAIAAIVSHNHIGTGTFTSLPHTHEVDDPGHQHVLTDRGGVLAGDGVARADIDSDDRICLFGSYDLVKNSKSADTGILIENSTTVINSSLQILHTGTVAENNNTANIPPFVSLCYIIKITG